MLLTKPATLDFLFVYIPKTFKSQHATKMSKRPKMIFKIQLVTFLTTKIQAIKQRITPK